jgi:hypothetical protein
MFFFYISRNNVFLFILCLQYFSIIYQLQYHSQETELWFGDSVWLLIKITMVS